MLEGPGEDSVFDELNDFAAKLAGRLAAEGHSAPIEGIINVLCAVIASAAMAEGLPAERLLAALQSAIAALDVASSTDDARRSGKN